MESSFALNLNLNAKFSKNPLISLEDMVVKECCKLVKLDEANSGLAAAVLPDREYVEVIRIP